MLYAAGAASRPSAGFRVEIPEFAIGAGSAVALLGSSGVGKSTLIRALCGLDGHGDVRWEGQRFWGGVPFPETGTTAHRSLLRRDICVLPQDARAAFDPLQRLGDQVRRVASPDEGVDIATALRELGVDDGAALCRRYPHEVSGGQAQAMLLAMALLRRPKLLVADEPSTGLDPARVDELARQLRITCECGSALLVATHDHEFAASIGARGWGIRAGRLEPVGDDVVAWPGRPRASIESYSPILRARGIGIRHGNRWIVRDVDVDLCAGESVGLVGPSGAGKSSIARVLAGLEPAITGRVEIDGPRVAVQLLFQDAYASLTPHRTIRAQVRECARRGFDVDAEAAALALETETLDRVPAELSGGERRRAALLRALGVRPRILVLDEPTAELDRATAVDVVRTLLSCQARDGLAMLWITHDRGLAAAVTDRTINLPESA